MANKNMNKQKVLLEKAKEIETVKKGYLAKYMLESVKPGELNNLTSKYKSQAPRVSVIDR
jgi:hypothetical protein